MNSGGSDCIKKGLRNGRYEVRIRGSMKEKRNKFFLACNFLVVAIFKLLS
jgi:hypothetical protein